MLAATAWVTAGVDSGPPPRMMSVCFGKPWPPGKPASARSFLAASGSNSWMDLSSSCVGVREAGHQPGVAGIAMGARMPSTIASRSMALANASRTRLSSNGFLVMSKKT